MKCDIVKLCKAIFLKQIVKLHSNAIKKCADWISMEANTFYSHWKEKSFISKWLQLITLV